ncbi:MAG: HAD-IC family P-type ATPase, partial [Carnobacterium sp.]
KELTILEDAKAGIGDRTNMAFMNSNVTYGRGEGIIVGTGMNTEVGEIAQMLASTDETMTPLQTNLNRLGKYLTVAILVIAIIMFVVGLLNGRGWLDMLLTSISLAVAAIPEGLPAIVTIILALGTQKMAKRKALVRKLPAVETLGSTDIICSDKTGTLTMNKMTVEKLFINGNLQNSDSSIDVDSPVLRSMIYANDTQISGDDTLIGDPTETALINFGDTCNVFSCDERENYPRCSEIPFDSGRKLMSTSHELKDGFTMVTKGAVDVLLTRMTHIQKNGQVLPLTKEDKQRIEDQNQEFSRNGLRVLGFAYKKI